MFISAVLCLVETYAIIYGHAVHIERLAEPWGGLGQDRRGLGEEKSAGTLQTNQVSVNLWFLRSHYIDRQLFLCSCGALSQIFYLFFGF